MDRRRVLQGMGLGAVGLAGRGWGAVGVGAVVKTTCGPVKGYRAGGAVIGFKGIPYGADTRTTRFQAPRAAVAWTYVRDCREWGSRAPQQAPDRAQAQAVQAGFNALEGAAEHYHLPPDEGAQDEDCLHVNVWTANVHGKAPVLVYLHGGAYNNGTVNAALYDGTRLAAKGCVVVTVNHRLNAFGFLYVDGVGEGYKGSGNAGMMDLVLALKWVRDNAAAFGGDASRVTIFGQSGGGAKCATLMAMDAAKGLFQRIWTMSGQQVWAAPVAKAERNAQGALAAMGIVGTPTAERLNALTVTQIQTGARTTQNWLPVKDDVVLKRDPFEPDAPQMSDGVAMVLGNTRDEIYGSTYWQRTALTWDTLADAMRQPMAAFKGQYSVEEIVKAYRGWYPGYSPNDVFTAALAAFRSWPGQVIEAERRASAEGAAKRTWVYQMDWGSPMADGRSPHTVDLAFVFDNLRLAPGMVGVDVRGAQGLATLMSDRLVAFAKTGVPGAGWPVYGLRERETMMFDRVSKVVSNPRGQEREMMVGARWRQPGT